MRIFLVLLLVACRNDAISFMHAVDPNARCNALNTATGFGDKSDTDTATCVSGGRVLLCSAAINGKTIPHCDIVTPLVQVPAEKP